MFKDMEKWVEIRRRVLSKEISKRQACRDYKIPWRTLQRILEHVEPPGYQLTQPRPKRKLERFLPIIHEMLERDRQAPRKQRLCAVGCVLEVQTYASFGPTTITARHKLNARPFWHSSAPNRPEEPIQ